MIHLRGAQSRASLVGCCLIVALTLVGLFAPQMVSGCLLGMNRELARTQLMSLLSQYPDLLNGGMMGGMGGMNGMGGMGGMMNQGRMPNGQMGGMGGMGGMQGMQGMNGMQGGGMGGGMGQPGFGGFGR